MDISTAQAMILREAIVAASALIAGDIDGKKRVPWDNHAMNADEGESVPAELTTEAGYWALLNDLDDRLAHIAGIAQ